jgi:hypothetical protein
MITIPKQYYVGRRKQSAAEGSVSLGFATPYDDNHTKAFEKRKATVDSWTGQYGAKPDNSLIIDNTPVEGFKIGESVRRVYWGGGNVVWRIEDPRGFELEIASSNLARIIDCANLVSGVIQGKCVWGRDGGQNVLLPENSEPFKEATTNTIRASQKVSLKDVKMGDIVTLKDGRDMEYLGIYSFVYDKYKWVSRYPNSYYTHEVSVCRRHVLKGKGDTYEYIASPNISYIVETNRAPVDMAAVAKTLSAKAASGSYGLCCGPSMYAVFVSEDNIKPADIEMATVPVPDVNATLYTRDSYKYCDLMFYTSGNSTMYVRAGDRVGNMYIHPAKVDLKEMTYTKDSGVGQPVAATTVQSMNPYWLVVKYKDKTFKIK